MIIITLSGEKMMIIIVDMAMELFTGERTRFANNSEIMRKEERRPEKAARATKCPKEVKRSGC